jgi:hypothetical protein
MIRPAIPALAFALLFLVPGTGHASLTPYTGTFESLGLADPNALATDGWIIYGNVFSPAHAHLYGYGAYPAPNNAGGFCAIAAGEGGLEQGAQQLSIYSDYNNADQANGNFVEANTFHEQTIEVADVGGIWRLQFDAKLGNLTGSSTASAFIKTIDPSAGYATTNLITVSTTAIPTNWQTYSIDIPVTAELAGQLMQFGFAATSTLYEGSGVYYDNVVWSRIGTVGVGAGPNASVLELRSAAPNPFSGATRIEYSLTQRAVAELVVYDVVGRRVATLFTGQLEAGLHTAMWDGRTDSGSLAPAGIYQCVVQTAAGRESRSLVLSR